MKTKFAFILFCALTISKMDAQIMGNQKVNPLMTIENKNDLERKKNLWIEKSHRTAPGVLWRDIERVNMLNKFHSSMFSKNSNAVQNYADGLCGTWAERGSNNQAGRCVGVDYDSVDNSLYVLGNDGSLFQGVPDTSNWHPVNDQLEFKNNIIKIIKNADGTKRILSVIDLNIYYSDDDGITFHPSSGISFQISWGGNQITEIASLTNPATNSTTLYLVARPWDPTPFSPRYWLYSSTDYGQSWQQIYTFPYGGDDNRLKLWKPDGQELKVYALFNADSGSQSTLYSMDGSSNVSIVNTSTSLPTNTGLLFSGNLTGTTTTLYALTGSNALYKSLDLGSTWTNTGPLPSNADVLAVSPYDANKIFIGEIEAHRSFDGGKTWTIVNTWQSYYGNPATLLHADIFNIKYFKNKNGTPFIIINCDGGCYRSDDDLQTVTNIGLQSLNVSEYYSVIADSQGNLFMGSQDQGIQRVANITANTNILDFDQIISGDFGKFQLTRDNQTLWAEYPGGNMFYYYNSTDAGYTYNWNLPGTTKPVVGWMLATAPTYPTSLNKIYLAGGNLSGDSGSFLVQLTGTNSTVTATQGNFDFRGNTSSGISAIGTTPLDPNRIYVAREDGAFFYSKDGGINWATTTNFSGPAPQYLFGNSIYASKITPDLVLLGGSGYNNPGVYKSTDGGSTFSPMNVGLPLTFVYNLTANKDESYIYAATEAGPYVFSVATNTWYPLGGGHTPVVAYWDVNYDSINNIAHFASFGRGIWDFKVCDPLSDVTFNSENNDVLLYPNPFSNSASLKFKNSPECSYFLNIYDIQGRLVRSINDIKTDTVTIEKQNLTNGIYLYKLQSDNLIISSGKLIIN